jgi:hypothetical protein
VADRRPPPEWRNEIDPSCIPGSFLMTEVVFFRRRSSTCLVSDLIQKHDDGARPCWQQWVLKAGGVLGAEGSRPRD